MQYGWRTVSRLSVRYRHKQASAKVGKRLQGPEWGQQAGGKRETRQDVQRVQLSGWDLGPASHPARKSRCGKAVAGSWATSSEEMLLNSPPAHFLQGSDIPRYFGQTLVCKWKRNAEAWQFILSPSNHSIPFSLLGQSGTCLSSFLLVEGISKPVLLATSETSSDWLRERPHKIWQGRAGPQPVRCSLPQPPGFYLLGQPVVRTVAGQSSWVDDGRCDGGPSSISWQGNRCGWRRFVWTLASPVNPLCNSCKSPVPTPKSHQNHQVARAILRFPCPAISPILDGVTPVNIADGSKVGFHEVLEWEFSSGAPRCGQGIECASRWQLPIDTGRQSINSPSRRPEVHRKSLALGFCFMLKTAPKADDFNSILRSSRGTLAMKLPPSFTATFFGGAGEQLWWMAALKYTGDLRQLHSGFTGSELWTPARRLKPT